MIDLNAAMLAEPQDYGCCALDDAAGTGHDGPCAAICHHCQGSAVRRRVTAWEAADAS